MTIREPFYLRPYRPVTVFDCFVTMCAFGVDKRAQSGCTQLHMGWKTGEGATSGAGRLHSVSTGAGRARRKDGACKGERAL